MNLKFTMHKSIIILSLSFVSLFFYSCGNTKNTTKKGNSTQSQGSGVTANESMARECGCTSEYKPVCGLTQTETTQTVDNLCISNCLGYTLSHYLRCQKDQSTTQYICYNGQEFIETQFFNQNSVLISSQWSLLKYGRCNQYSM